jgi:Cys-tRNA(Pro)/Cys-tRNA(Cys) deacylase
MPLTNNVTRMLDNRKIQYTAFELTAEKRSALETAQILGVPPEIVYKTILILRPKPGKPILVVVPGPKEVDLKAVAAFLGEKKVQLPTQNEAEKITGLQAGGISPLALINKGFQVLLDESANQYEQIHISGGQRDINIRLPVEAFLDLTHARLAKVSQ